MATPAPFPAPAPAAPVPPPNPEVEAAAQPAPATPSGPAAASDEEVKERVPFIDIILEDGEKHLDLVEGGPRVSGQFEAGDYVMGKFRNDQWYSGTIGAINEDGTFRMNYDDGDVENLTIDRLRTMEEFTAQGLTAATSNRQPKVETVSNFVGKDGTKIECTDGAARANSLTKLFDGRHGRPDTDSSEWRVRMIKGRNVRITITFAEPYFITRTRLFPASFNTKKASSNYSLTAIPFVPRFMASVPKPLNVTQGVVGCEHIRIGEWHEYRIDQPLSALVIEFPPHADPNRQHISFGGIDIYHSPAKLASHSIESQSTFRTDFAYLLNNQKFSDCVIKCDGENVYAHKNILAARSEYFRHMFDGPYRESDSSTQEVEMKDVNGRVFLLMMRYLYTDSLAVQSLDDAVELWCVADRLQLTYLKVLVEQFIDGDLSTEKAIGACRLPSIDLYDGLKFRLVSYLADHFEDVMDSEEFVRIPAPILHQVLCQVKAKKAIDLLLKKDKSPGGSNGK